MPTRGHDAVEDRDGQRNASRTATAAETLGGATRFVWRTRNLMNRPNSCPISTNTNSATIASTAASG